MPATARVAQPRTLSVIISSPDGSEAAVDLICRGKTGRYTFARTAARTYAVEEFGGRVYAVALSRVPALDRCSCPAGAAEQACKHTAAARKLIELRVLAG